MVAIVWDYRVYIEYIVKICRRNILFTLTTVMELHECMGKGLFCASTIKTNYVRTTVHADLDWQGSQSVEKPCMCEFKNVFKNPSNAYKLIRIIKLKIMVNSY